MFYIAHRLFAAHDRHLGALAAARLAAEVGPDRVFLPFCDTDEENLQATVKGRRLFELDRQRLPHLQGMLAILHGPSLDDGVCMEVGYATALGVPVVVLTTDFQTYGRHDRASEFIFPEPLIQAVASDTIRGPYLATAAGGGTDRFEVFARRNRDQTHIAVDQAVLRLLTLARPPTGHARPDRLGHAVFVEPSPYQHGELWDKVITWLRTSGRQLRPAHRFEATGDSIEAARADWAVLTGCRTLLADVTGPETPPGAALMIGACAARDQQALAVGATTTWTFAAGREPNWRNLMIQYAVHARVDTVDQLPTLLSP